MDSFIDGEVGGILSRLKNDPNAISEFPRTFSFELRIEVKNTNFTRVSSAEPFENFHGRGLARPVWPQNGEYLALLNG
jgi:hypothetical protein